MAVPRMHEDEVEVDGALVARLVATQFPGFAGRPLARVEAWGTDHAVFRLGDDLSVRLPKIGWAAGQGELERRWLPVLAPHLPAEVPTPLAIGAPSEAYPYPWYVSPWLTGDNPLAGAPVDLCRLAVDLAAFVRALRRVDVAGAPTPRPARRGGPLAAADRATRARADELRDEADVDALLAAWDAGVHAPAWGGPPTWAHGDLSDGNLLVRGGRLTGVIDWGCLVAGDPAVDLMPAWTLFDAESRGVYRDALGGVDDPLWRRGRAWATSAALQALPYYRDTNPDIVARSWRTVREVLNDQDGAP